VARRRPLGGLSGWGGRRITEKEKGGKEEPLVVRNDSFPKRGQTATAECDEPKNKEHGKGEKNDEKYFLNWNF